MLRRFLALYMAFVLVAGPSLCCCTTLYEATPPSSAGSTAPSSNRTPPCCCQERQPKNDVYTSGGLRGGGGDSKPAPMPGEHECPCKNKGNKPTLVQTSSSLTVHEVARLLTTTPHCIAAAFNVVQPVDPGLHASRASPPGHRLTSWRLLNAPHMLRC